MTSVDINAESFNAAAGKVVLITGQSPPLSPAGSIHDLNLSQVVLPVLAELQQRSFMPTVERFSSAT